MLWQRQGLTFPGSVTVSQDCSRQPRGKKGDVPVLDLVLVDLDQILLRRLPQGQSLDYLNLQRKATGTLSLWLPTASLLPMPLAGLQGRGVTDQ